MSSVPFRSKKSAAELVAGLRSDPHAPISAMIEIADRCNETCVHCYQIQGQKGELETDDWRRILDELAAMGVVFLTISGGEATLRRDFLDIVAYARAKRFAVKIFTNGLTMSEELARQLRAHAVQEVQISLYSHRAEIHDGVTCVPGSWDKTVAGARHLVAVGVPVVIKSPLMRFNVDELDAYVDFVEELGADYALDPHLDPREDGDRDPESLRIDDDAYLRVRRHPRLDAGAADVPTPRPLDDSLCMACSGNVHIEANGEIRPCTQLTVPVGHALVDGVQNAWTNDEAGKRIRATTWRDLPGCRGCDLRAYCGRCFANALVETGDALAPYPSACHKAKLGYELVHGGAPEIRAGARGDVRVGPYAHVGEHAFEAAGYEVGDHPGGWARRAPGSAPGLVQIRHPAAKKQARRVKPCDGGSVD